MPRHSDLAVQVKAELQGDTAAPTKRKKKETIVIDDSDEEGKAKKPKVPAAARRCALIMYICTEGNQGCQTNR